MKSNNNTVLDEVCVSLEAQGVHVDSAAIEMAKKNYDKKEVSFAVKLLALVGGVVSCLLFLVTLFSLNLLKSTAVDFVLMILSWGLALWINKKYHSVSLETASVVLFLMSYVFLFFALNTLDIRNLAVSSLYVMVLAGATLFFFRNYILSFLATLSLIIALYFFLTEFFNYYYVKGIYLSFLILVASFMFLKEAKVLASGSFWVEGYNPIRLGLFSCIILGSNYFDSFLLYNNDFVNISFITPLKLASFVAVFVLIYTFYQLMEARLVSRKNQWVLLVLGIFCFVPTLWMPGVSISFLLLVLSFRSLYKTGIVLSLLFFIYSITRFYYDLDLSLLSKSLLLMGTGGVLLVVYALLSKKMRRDEEV